MPTKRMLSLCVSLSAVMFASAAQAQPPAASPGSSSNPPEPVVSPAPAGAASSTDIGDIIVTARRIAENVQKVPLAITALSGASLQQAGVRGISDISSTVPNLNVEHTPGNPTSLVVTIRGQGAGDTLLTIDNPVGIYIDGVNVPRLYGLSAALIDVQRVEVLRGPQGTLYGRNTTGGAFSIITKDPGKDFGGSVQLTGGNYALFGATGIVNIPLSDDIGVRFVAQHSQHDGYAKNASGTGMLNDNSEYYRGKIKLVSGDFTASISGDYTDIKTNGAAGNIVGLTPANSATGTPEGGALTLEAAAQFHLTIPQAVTYLEGLINRPNFYSAGGVDPTGTHYRGESVAATLEYKVGDAFTLRSITGYRHFYQTNLQDQEGSPVDILTPNQATRDNSFTEEFQVLGGDKHFNWVVGAFYSDETGHEISVAPVAPLINFGFVQTQDNDVKGTSIAGFAQANWEFAPGWSLTAGGRYTRERKSIVTRNSTIFGCVVPVQLRDSPTVCQGHLGNTYADPSWTGSLQYELSPNARVYAKVARGFRGGGQNLRGSTTLAAYAPFAPEQLTEYELGLKSELFDRRLRLNLAAYYDDYKDVQRNVLVGSAGGGVATVVTNAAAARLIGFEGEAYLRATDKLTFNATFGHNNAKYKQFSDLTGDRRTEPWPAPDWTWVLGGRYVEPTSLGKAALQLDYSWQSTLNLYPSASLRSQVTQKAYGLLSGRISLDVERLGVEAALFSRNLLNKKYYAGAVSVEALGFNTLYTGEPRVFGIQVTKKFGSER